jgi:hypothetical protein
MPAAVAGIRAAEHLVIDAGEYVTARRRRWV